MNSLSFIHKTIGENYTLEKSIDNQFNRFTLVNNHLTERVTIDSNLSFNGAPFYQNLVILELKQERINRHSPVYQSLSSMGIHPMRLSKYCMGMAKSDASLKQNIFKSKFNKISKINNGLFFGSFGVLIVLIFIVVNNCGYDDFYQL